MSEPERAVGTPPSTRVEGYLPIRSFAALGDGRTVALVGDDGTVEWWALPTLDSPPVIAAVLDPDEGGRLVLRPAGPFTTSRRYVPETNVLETTFYTSSGSVRVTDALTVGVAGLLPWGEFVRRVDCLEGEVEIEWQVVPGDRFRTARPWIEQKDSTILIHVGDQLLALRCFDIGSPRVQHDEVSGKVTLAAGETGVLGFTASDHGPLFLPGREEFLRDLDRTVARWREWSACIEYDGPWRSAIVRSALALKTLLYTPSGAIAAAPTTSFPESIGGTKNYDYRYMWLRDASFSADALMSLKLHEEVQSAISFVLGCIERTAPNVHVFYGLDGKPRNTEEEIPVPGYRRSRPVRSGNGASGQTQLGTFGDVFDAMWRYVRNGHLLDAATAALLADLADRCCDKWMSKDSGIWELQVERHYTISKIGCWVALDRAIKLAEHGTINTGHVDRWTRERATIRAWIEQNCWSTAKNSYTLYAGTDDLDAATLLAARTGFDTGDRLAGTVDAVRRELAEGPLVYRYTGMREEENAFVACTFWMVDALAALKRLDEAHALMKEAVELANDIGLLSEQMNPGTRELLGNFPQGLSHLALINAATTLARG